MSRATALCATLLFVSSACGGSSGRDAHPPQPPTTAGTETVLRDSAEQARSRSERATAAASIDSEAEGAEPSMELPTRPTPQHVTSGASDEYDALLDADRNLGSTLGLATVDCRSAREFRDRICELSQRICDLAHAGADHTTRQRCEDGAMRCERASRRVAAACPE